ncbi:hypothetical protein GCM10010466_50350 [Planomonospora alba]|uniref:Uncharacterized protein n=1 Tax=Planomonospora alba TaxID=161354 RepID=A0ABP6NMI3_9ACTN
MERIPETVPEASRGRPRAAVGTSPRRHEDIAEPVGEDAPEDVTETVRRARPERRIGHGYRGPFIRNKPQCPHKVAEEPAET